jgi:hypothetical protein
MRGKGGMKKQNTLRTLGGALLSAITLMLVLFCFLTACEDGYKPNVKEIRFYQSDVKKKNLISNDNPLKVNSTATNLIIKCTIPSGVKELSIDVKYPKELEVTPDFAFEDDANVIIWEPGRIKVDPLDAATDLTLQVKAKSSFTSGDKGTIKVIIGTGGDADASADCAFVFDGTPLFVAVTNITNIPSSVVAGTLTLNGTVVPANATNTIIDWSLTDAGATGATINGNTLTTTTAGSVKVTATIVNGIAVGTDYMKTFTITITGGSPSPTYNISLSQTAPYVFTAATTGYGAQTPLTVTVTNMGNQATGALTVALGGTNQGSFTLSTTSITSIASPGTDTFTVVPNTGLSAGTYTATVTVSGGNGITASFTVSFTVNTLVTDNDIGLTAPVTGATPDTTITNTSQYTGTVAWSDSPSTFAGGTVYTATITLTPVSGYTLAGLAANFFTVNGITATFTSPNTVTVVFPATIPSTPGVTITITFTVTDGNLTASPSTGITYAGLKGGSQTVALSFSNGPYTGIVWDMDGEVLSGFTSDTLTINSGFSKLDKLVSGTHVINVSGTRTSDGLKYSGTVQITIAMVP